MPLGMEAGLGPGDTVLEGNTASPTFRPISIVAKWSPISATAELLLIWLNADTLTTMHSTLPCEIGLLMSEN